MYPSVTEVAACDDYILPVSFENGEKGRLDIKPMLDFGIFRRLKDGEAFKRVRVSFDTIQWDCGPDLDPEFIYRECIKTGY